VFQPSSGGGLFKSEATPLVVDGVMYTVGPPNEVVALDAVTGRILWTRLFTPADTTRTCCGRVNRGLALSTDKLFFGTLDGHLLALSVKDGRTIWDVPIGRPEAGYSLTHAPLVVKNMVIAGPGGGEFGIRGFLAAFDVDTGKELWRFYTVPAPGEPGAESWSGDSWRTGGAAVWMTGSYDPETNLTYWGTGNPAPVWNGDSRADNLYSDSVVALDADTGKLKWHFQFTKHDERDLDSGQVPVLADHVWRGRPRKLMMWPNKNGHFYVLDRTTGELLSDQSLGATIGWYSPSFSPTTGLLYVPVFGVGDSAIGPQIIKEPAKYVEGQRFLAGRPGQPSPARTGYAAVFALTPDTGKPTWEFRTPTSGVLTTASNVLFTGARDRYFHALDARSGRELWKMNLGGAVEAAPITYAVNGRQYVAITTGAALFVFALS